MQIILIPILIILFTFILCKIGNEISNEESFETINPIYLSEYIIWYSKHKLNILVNKDKIMAILYVVQGLFLSKNKRPLFNEDFEAWSRGPILPSVYREYKVFGSSLIPLGPLWNQETYDINLNEYDLKLFNDVIAHAAPYTGYSLIENLSKQRPWIKNYRYSYEGKTQKIPKEDIKEYFDEVK